MMAFPLNFTDITIWLAAVALILIVASETLMQYSRAMGVQINRKRLRNIALAVSVLFLTTAAIRVISVLLAR